MERGLILLAAALVVCVSQGVQGTAHLSFSNNTQVNISREGCGTAKLCRELPTGCDPTVQGSCLFLSAAEVTAPAPPNGFELTIELRGESDGYIALALTPNPSLGTTKLFICAVNRNTNNTIFFRTMNKNDTTAVLSPNEMTVREIRGVVNGSVIMCEFNIPNLNATNTRTSHISTFNVSVGRGPINGTAIGAFNASLNAGPVNLRDPANPTTAPATTMPANATMPTNTTMPNSGAAVQPHAVLLLLSVLTLSFMPKA